MGTSYKAGKCCMLIGTSQDLTNQFPLFGLLYDIILYDQEPKILFVFNVLNTASYNTLYGAYEVTPSINYRCFYRSSLSCYHLFSAIHYGENENMFIKSKYSLSVYCHY